MSIFQQMLSAGQIAFPKYDCTLTLKQQPDGKYSILLDGVELPIVAFDSFVPPRVPQRDLIAGRLAEGRDFGAVFYLKDDRTAEFSLRSRGAFDVSSVARLFGGGGHRNAAGFTVSIAQLVPQERK